MKKIILLTIAICAGVAFSVAQNQETKKQEAKPESALHWLQPVADLGEVPKGIPATATYEFVNKGNKPIVITNVRASCGCTSKKYSKEPIKPGETSKIEATYKAARVGKFHKTITVTTNEGAKPKVLRIKGTVVVKEEKK